MVGGRSSLVFLCSWFGRVGGGLRTRLSGEPLVEGDVEVEELFFVAVFVTETYGPIVRHMAEHMLADESIGNSLRIEVMRIKAKYSK